MHILIFIMLFCQNSRSTILIIPCKVAGFTHSMLKKLLQLDSISSWRTTALTIGDNTFVVHCTFQQNKKEEGMRNGIEKCMIRAEGSS